MRILYLCNECDIEFVGVEYGDYCLFCGSTDIEEMDDE